MDEAPADVALAQPGPPDVRRNSSKRWLITIAKGGFTTVVVASVGYATVREWPAVRETLMALAWPYVLASYILVVLGLLAQARSMRAALSDLGHPVDGRSAAKIYLVGLLGKYLPGSVWTFVMQMELGRRAGVPRERALLAPLICLALSTTSAMLLSLLILPGLRSAGAFVVAAVVVLVPTSLAVAHPRVLNWLVGRFLALTRRPPLPSKITGRAIGVIIAWSTLAWVCFGIHLWLLAGGSAAAGPGGLVRCIGAFALALTAGIFAFLSPSGLGVREAVIVAGLLPYLPAGVALGMALASRLIFTAADVTAAGAALAAESRLFRSAAVARQADDGADTIG